jgi:Thiamine pyrophosphate enzyme, central domain
VVSGVLCSSLRIDVPYRPGRGTTGSRPRAVKSAEAKVGGSANRPGLAPALSAAVRRLKVPFFNTQMGKGAVDGNSELFVGTAAVSEGDYVHLAIERADLIVAVGHDTAEKPPFIMRAGGPQVVHVDFNVADIDQIYFPQVEVVGDIQRLENVASAGGCNASPGRAMARWQMRNVGSPKLAGSDLDDRIAAAFGDGVTSAHVAILIAEAERAAVASGESAEHARGLALDPALTAGAVAEARQEMEDSAFRRERLQAAVTRLKERLREVRALEENQQRLITYEKTKAERDSLAAELRASYPNIEARLGELIAKIEASDRMVEFVNTHGLPTGAVRLRSAELVARGLEAWRVNSADVVRITRELCLPAFKHDPHKPYAWPRSR